MPWPGAGALLPVAVTGELYFGLDGEVPLGDLPHWVAQAFAPGQYGLPIFANLILVALPLFFSAALVFTGNARPLVSRWGLFAVMPLCSGLSHWFNSEQHNHWFGYWFGHDMFTPPFAGPDGKLTYDAKLRGRRRQRTQRQHGLSGNGARRGAFWRHGPGPVLPHLHDFLRELHSAQLPAGAGPEFDRRDVYIITQNALADNTYLDYIRAQYNRSAQIDPPFFQNFLSGTLPSIFHGPTRWLAWLDDIFEGSGPRWNNGGGRAPRGSSRPVSRTRETGGQLRQGDQPG